MGGSRRYRKVTRMRLASILFLFIMAAVFFNSLAAAAPITLTPSKDTYYPGDTLVVSGTATPNSAVTIQLYNPATNRVAVGQDNTDAAGQYTITVWNWPAIPTLTIPFGIYSIKATDSATGDIAETVVEYAQLGNLTTTTVTITTTTTFTSTTTSTTTLRTTVTSITTTTTTTTSRTTSTTTSITTRTSTTTTTLPARTTTVTTASTTTATSTTTQTTTSTAVSTALPSTTTVTSEITETVGLPAEITYAAVAVAAIAVIAAVILTMRRRA